MSKNLKLKNNTKTFSGNNTISNTGGNTANSTIHNYTNRPFSKESAFSGGNVTQYTRTCSLIPEAKRSNQKNPSHTHHMSQGNNNFISANETFSTAANVKSKLFSRSSTSIGLESAKSKTHHEHRGSVAHSIKMEIFEDMEKALASPKNLGNKLDGLVDVKGQMAINKNNFVHGQLPHSNNNFIANSNCDQVNNSKKKKINEMNTISILHGHKAQNPNAYKHLVNALKINSENNVLSYSNRQLLPSVTMNENEKNFRTTTGSAYSVFPRRLTESK
jgi:hypothetical protein